MKKVRLTESQLHRVIYNTAKRMIKESEFGDDENIFDSANDASEDLGDYTDDVIDDFTDSFGDDNEDAYGDDYEDTDSMWESRKRYGKRMNENKAKKSVKKVNESRMTKKPAKNNHIRLTESQLNRVIIKTAKEMIKKGLY